MINEKKDSDVYLNLNDTTIEVDPGLILGKLHYKAIKATGMIARKLFGNGRLGNTAIDVSKDLKNGKAYFETSDANLVEFLFIKTKRRTLSLGRMMTSLNAKGAFIAYFKEFTGRSIPESEIKIGKINGGSGDKDCYYVCPYRYLPVGIKEPSNVDYNIIRSAASSGKVYAQDAPGSGGDGDDSDDNSSTSGGSSSRSGLTPSNASIDPSLKFSGVLVNESDKIDLEKLFLEKISLMEKQNAKNK